MIHMLILLLLQQEDHLVLVGLVELEVWVLLEVWEVPVLLEQLDILVEQLV
jgi:hypothetical protein